MTPQEKEWDRVKQKLQGILSMEDWYELYRTVEELIRTKK